MPPIDRPESRRLCEEISALSGGTVFLAFSRGKDSTAAWLQLKKYFKRIIPYHLASVPHLSFADESLAYFEKVFGTPILRFMSGETIEALNMSVYQPIEDEDAIDDLALWTYDQHDIADLLRKKFDAPMAWTAYGINQSDSIDRRIYVNKFKGRIDNWSSFYPCWDWSGADILETIREAGIMLPNDYLLSNRSLAGIPNVRHLTRMEQFFPSDMKRIEEMFPFIRSVLARNEFRKMRETQPEESSNA